MITKSLLLHSVRLRGGRTQSTTTMSATNPLWTSAKVFGACNGLGLGISLAKDTHTHLDLIGTGAFAVAAYATKGPTASSRTSALMVGAWATRLASFLFYRALGHSDGRLEGTTKTLQGCVGFWFVSFVWGWLTLITPCIGGVRAESREQGIEKVGPGLVCSRSSDRGHGRLPEVLFQAKPQGLLRRGALVGVAAPELVRQSLFVERHHAIQRAGALARQTGARGGVAGLPGSVVWCPQGVPDAGRGACRRRATARTRASPRIWRTRLYSVCRVDKAIAALASGLVGKGVGPGGGRRLGSRADVGGACAGHRWACQTASRRPFAPRRSVSYRPLASARNSGLCRGVPAARGHRGIVIMSKEVTVTFQGELGIELHVDRASGTVRIKRAEADSPAKPHEGAALRSINGTPVGKIVDKAAWLALVERLKAPARPLVLALAVPEDPVQRARAELDALAASAKAEAEAAAAASAPAPTRGRRRRRASRIELVERLVERRRKPAAARRRMRKKEKGQKGEEEAAAAPLTRLDLAEPPERSPKRARERTSKRRPALDDFFSEPGVSAAPPRRGGRLHRARARARARRGNGAGRPPRRNRRMAPHIEGGASAGGSRKSTASSSPTAVAPALQPRASDGPAGRHGDHGGRHPWSSARRTIEVEKRLWTSSRWTLPRDRPHIEGRASASGSTPKEGTASSRPTAAVPTCSCTRRTCGAARKLRKVIMSNSAQRTM